MRFNSAGKIGRLKLVSLIGKKYEFEAEGLSITQMWSRRLQAQKDGLLFFVKIGGCEAKTDLDLAMEMNADGIIGPMIESEFALKKFENLVAKHADKLKKISINVETITAVDRVDALLVKTKLVNMVTIGRSDLSDSLGIPGKVESDEVMELVEIVSKKAKNKGLAVTLGGGVTPATIRNIRKRNLPIDFVETRNNVFDASFVHEEEILESLQGEITQIDQEIYLYKNYLSDLASRKEKVLKRIKSPTR